jgi:glycogen phosphorylase
VVPEFYTRDATGMPRRWIERVRRSMASLTPTYSSRRMARDYVEQYYLVGAAELRRRMADESEPARAMQSWETRLRRHWSGLHIGETSLSPDGEAWSCSVAVYLGEIIPAYVAVQLYADPRDGEAPYDTELIRSEPIIGATNGHIYAGTAPAARPAEGSPVRIISYFPGVRVPAELALTLWQK